MRSFNALVIVAVLIHSSIAAEPRAVDSEIEVTAALREPELVTPTGIAVAEDGAVLVIECHTHFRPPNYAGPPADRIRRCVDTNADGYFDQVTTFFEGTSATMNLAVYTDGSVFVATRGEVFRLFDDDKDGAADRRAPVARLETAGDYPHNGLSGFAFDRSGRVVFGLGENLGADYRLVAADGSECRGGGEGGSIYWVEPDGSKLERIATGLWNPFHVCFDPYGQLFAVDNDPDSRPPCRLLHVVAGGDYGYRFRNGRKGVHPFTAWNGELPGTLPMVAGTGEAPSGMIPFDKGFLITSWGDHRVDYFELVPKGASFEAVGRPFIEGPDDFRPVGIAQRDGDIFISDWVDRAYELHGKGRIWRVRDRLLPAKRPRIQKSAWAGNEAARDDSLELIHPGDLQRAAADRSQPLRRAAALRIIERRDDLPILREALADADPFIRQAAMIGLRRTTELDDWRGWLESPHPPAERLAAALTLRMADNQGVGEAHDCVERLLSDDDRDVRFVGIQWTAEARLVQHRPRIEALLNAPAFDRRQFEACLAALRMLEAPVGAKLEETAGEDLVLRVVADPHRPAPARTLGLRLLRPDHPGLKASLLEGLLGQDDGALRQAAVETLCQTNLPQQQKMLRRLAGDESLPVALRVEAIAGLSPRETASRTFIDRLLAENTPIVVEEALRTLRGVELAASQRERLEQIAADGTRPPAVRQLATMLLTPPSSEAIAVDALADVLEAPGRPDVGRRVFYQAAGAACFRCHRVGGRGGSAGPDLSSIGQRDPRRLLESIVDPAREVAPQFATATLVTEDGRTLVGLVEERPATAEVAVTDAEGRTAVIAASDVVERSATAGSIMPGGLAARMTREELRDLLAWLQTLK